MLRIGLAVALAVLLGGCVGPRIKVEHSTCQPIGDEGHLEEIVFRTNVATANMLAEQLIYEVGLLDTRSRPVPSRTSRFKNAAGHLAAGKTLMVLESPWTFDDVAVSIPGDELRAVEADRPAWAEFRVLNVDGLVLARERVRLPPIYAAGASPGEPVEAPTVASTAEVPVTAVAAERDAADVNESPPSTARPPRGRTPRSGSPAGRRTSPASREERARAVREMAEREAAGRAASETTEGSGSAPRVDDAGARVTESAPPPVVVVDSPAQVRQPSADGPAPQAPAPEAPPPVEIESVRAVPAPAVPAPAPPTAPGEYREYAVQPGDTLIGIAKRELRDPTRWYEVFDGNRDVLNSPDELRPGMTLRLPPAAEAPARSRAGE